MRSDFINAIRSNEAAFGVELSGEAVDQLARYHEMVLEHNPLLHLAAPMADEEFAIRHVLESLAMLRHLPEGARFADVGAGAGLPSIPCLIARGDLTATLIESKIKKTRFLETALGRLGLADRAEVVNRQFEEADIDECGFVACRALDRFTERLPRLLKWAGRRRLLLFGGPSLAEALTRAGRRYDEELLPLSERRYLYYVGV